MLLLKPAIVVASFFAMRWIGVPLPSPRFCIVTILALFAAFFIFGMGEEIGWSGYAIDRMQARHSALGTAIVLGAIWALWHIVPLVQAHRAPAWIAWWCLGTVATRVIIVWLYNNIRRSVFSAIVYHDVDNVAWLTFPIGGSYFDPKVTSCILVIVAVAVTLVWGARTLTCDSARRPLTGARQ